MHQTDLYGVVVDVHQAVYDITVVKDGLTEIAVAEYVAHAVVDLVVPAGEAGVDAVHEGDHRLDGGSAQEDVGVVAHDAIGDDLDVVVVFEAREVVEIGGFEGICGKDAFLADALDDDVEIG